MAYSSTTLIGNLGAKPETKIFDNGNSVTRFSLATSRSWKSANGEKQEKTEWHNVVLWGKMGELAREYLDKGSKVLIVGRIEYREAVKDDEKRYYTDIVAQEMKFLSPRQSNRNSPTNPKANVVYSDINKTDGDLPF